MKLNFCLGVALVFSVFASGCVSSDSIAEDDGRRPRVIVTTDFPPLDVIPGSICEEGDPAAKCSDPDDLQSMVRFLLYTNELDVEALVAATGTFANVANKQHLLDMLERYDAVDENLRRHDDRYPTADALRAITFEGMDGAIGTEDFAGADWRPIETLIGPEHDTEASEAIRRVLLEPAPEPIWIFVWGGPREAAQAIWKIRETETEETLNGVIGKVRFFMILKQDYTAEWLLDTFPDLFVIVSSKTYQGMFSTASDFAADTVDLAWVNENLRLDHGPLGAAYPKSGWNPAEPGVWEGDSPTFLHVVSGLRGLNDPEQPDEAGWGGRYIQPDPDKNHWYDHPDGPRSIYQWRPQFQAEFAERADWMKD